MPDITSKPSVVVSHCRCLRSKEMYIDAEPDLTVPNSSSGIYWCSHTQNCLGPDGRVAEPDSCKPDRACYDPV